MVSLGVVGGGGSCSSYSQSFFVLEFFVSMSDAHDFISITSCTYRKRKSMEPTNEHPRQCHERMKVLFTDLDKRRELDLSVPDEGICFVTCELVVR